MSQNRFRQVPFVLLTLAMLACNAPAASGGDAAATTIPDSAATPISPTVVLTETSAPSPTDYTAPMAVCDDLKALLLQSTGIEATVITEPLDDEAFFNPVFVGQACGFDVVGTVATVGQDAYNAQSKLTQAMEAEGWGMADMFGADGPVSSARTYIKENRVVFISADWGPTEAANCPQDQPVGMCDFSAPELQNFELDVVVAEAPAGAAVPTQP
jgi:hypothetical protein